MKCETMLVAGFVPAFYGARSPLNSWHLSDSYVFGILDTNFNIEGFVLGEKDKALAQRLIKGGNEHAKFLRQIQVWVEMEFPRYWWSEFDTYHFNTKNSTSTMHKLFDKKTQITLSMFEFENDYEKENTIEKMYQLNVLREKFFQAETQQEKDSILVTAKRILPENYLQKRVVNTNYAELRNIWNQRVKSPHRLKKEWVDTFGGWIDTLPYSKELITLTD